MTARVMRPRASGRGICHCERSEAIWDRTRENDRPMTSSVIGRAFVTGGAGFIGSHVVDRLARDGASVTIYDNFSTGQEQFIRHHAGNPKVNVVHADVL